MIEETQDVNTLLPEEEPIRLVHSYQEAGVQSSFGRSTTSRLSVINVYTSANEITEKDPETGPTGTDPAFIPWSPRLLCLSFAWRVFRRLWVRSLNGIRESLFIRVRSLMRTDHVCSSSDLVICQ
jgi:hypothetical protein